MPIVALYGTANNEGVGCYDSDGKFAALVDKAHFLDLVNTPEKKEFFVNWYPERAGFGNLYQTLQNARNGGTSVCETYKLVVIDGVPSIGEKVA